MSKIFDNIETKFEEGLHAIPGSADCAGLIKVEDTTVNTPKEAFELTVNCAELKVA